VADYATLADLKAALGITNDDTRDAALSAAISAASRYIDRRCGRKFDADSVATARVYNPRYRLVEDRVGQRFLVDDISTVTGLVVELGIGGAYTAITTYETAPENAIAKGLPIAELMFGGDTAPLQFITPWSRLRVTAKWGWPDVPDDIAQAALLYAARVFRRKDSPDGVLGSSEWGSVRVSARDPDVEAFLAPYILPEF